MQLSTTSSARSSPARTPVAISSAPRLQRPSLIRRHLDLRNEEEGIHHGGSVGEERIAAHRAGRHVGRLEPRSLFRRGGGARVAVELSHVVEDLAELRCEQTLFLARKAQPGEESNSPYFIDT